MGKYPDSFLEQIKNKVDIVDLISAYANVQRKGRDYWACCPFHSEKTPSFQIRSDHQYYRCYGCGKHGNIFNFLMDYENISFSEAVEALAKRAGLEVPQVEFDPEAKARKDMLNKIYDINREAALFYYQMLFTAKGTEARDYLSGRELDSKTVKKFGIGYSPDFTSLPAHLRAKGYDDKTLIAAGICSTTQNGEVVDFFGKRVVIPIIGGNKKVLGFSGRVLNPKPDFAKYKNTSTTLAFNKRKNLFGLNLYKDLHQSGARVMILVEGHMDVISLYQAGIYNAVASMGTSLTPEQCREIKRNAEIVYVSYDGDSAGQSATLRGLDLLKKEGLDIKVVCLKDNLDPDDYVRKYGKDGYLKLLDEAVPLIDYKLMKVEENFNLSNSDDKIKYTRAAIEVLNTLDSVEKEIYVKIVSEKSGIKPEVLIKQSEDAENNLEKIEIVKTGAQDGNNSDNDAALNVYKTAERYVLSAFIYGSGFITAEDLRELRDCLIDENYIEVFDSFIAGIAAGNKPKAADIFNIMDEKEAAFVIDALETVSPTEQATYYYSCVQKLKQYKKNKELSRLTAELLREADSVKRDQIKQKIKELSKIQSK